MSKAETLAMYERLEDALDKRPRFRETLFITDAELIRRIGVPEKIARRTIRELDAKRADWPKKNGIWGNRRYWPAVRAYLDRHGGLK